VYAHASIGHLLSNSLALLLGGLLVERRTTRWQFHLFFLTVGGLAGITQVLLSGVIGPATAVLGASGAVFGLFGYLLAGNVVTASLLDRVRLSPRAQFGLFALAALMVTVATGRPGVALVAHFTGLLLGLLAGAAGVLDR
jgi:membrane associated rhomboid family serine protease